MTFTECTKPLDQDTSGPISYKLPHEWQVTQEKSYVTCRTKNSLHFTESNSLSADDRGSFARTQKPLCPQFSTCSSLHLLQPNFFQVRLSLFPLWYSSFFKQFSLNLLSYQLQNLPRKADTINQGTSPGGKRVS